MLGFHVESGSVEWSVDKIRRHSKCKCKVMLWVIRPSMIAACFHFPKVWEPNAIREAGTPEGSHAEGNRSKRPHRFTLYPTLEISSGETVGQMCWSKPGFVSVKLCVCNIACVRLRTRVLAGVESSRERCGKFNVSHICIITRLPLCLSMFKGNSTPPPLEQLNMNLEQLSQWLLDNRPFHGLGNVQRTEINLQSEK